MNFKQVFSDFWANFQARKQYFSSLRQWWDYGKVVLKQLCQQYTFNVSRHITDSMKHFEFEILELHRLMDSTGDLSHAADLKYKKTALANLLGFRAQVALV